jgi:hypothetical protein
MAKDPAFLFYPGDWQGGTVTMSRHMKGCYIDLLVAEFNSGPLSLEEIKTVLGTDFAVWGSLSKKFKQTSEGLFFNERLESEKSKRTTFTQKQKERINKRWNKPGTEFGNTAVLPVENRNENEIEDWNEWGLSILKQEDATWEEMRGRKISQEELQEFLSVATRNGWEMKTQQAFRTTLMGFRSNGKIKQDKNPYKLH